MAVVVSACGGLTGPGPSGSSFTATDAQNLAKNFAAGATNGANAGNRASTSGTHALVGDLRGPVANGVSCTANGSSCQIFEQYSQTTTCDGGGRITASGTISGSISNGSLGPFGSISLTQSDAISNWACEGGWVVNGDPMLTDVGTITLTGSHSSFSFRQGGSFLAVATADGTKVSCQVNTSVTWDSSFGGSFSGTENCAPGGTFNVNGTF
jgi:hypothetical protein